MGIRADPRADRCADRNAGQQAGAVTGTVHTPSPPLAPHAPHPQQKAVSRAEAAAGDATASVVSGPIRRRRGEVSAGHAANMDGVAAVDRALSLVGALADAGRALTLTELATATGLYKSTVLRLLVSLERALLVQRRADQRYGLGPMAFRIGHAYELHHHLQAAVQPVIAELVAGGSESPSFHVPHDGQRRLCLLRQDSHHSTLDRVRAGDLLPLHQGAPGKVLMRHAQGVAALRLAGTQPEPETSFGERDPLCGAVALPVFGPGGALMGALSLSGPLERFRPEAVPAMVPALQAAAARATRALGGDWPTDRLPHSRVERSAARASERRG